MIKCFIPNEKNGKLVVRIDKNEEHEFGKKRRRENLELEEKIKNISKDESRHTKLAQTAATSNKKNTMLTKKKSTISTKFIIIIIIIIIVVKKIGKLINNKKEPYHERIVEIKLAFTLCFYLTQSQGFPPIFINLFRFFLRF